jgi:hypothetical protein
MSPPMQLLAEPDHVVGLRLVYSHQETCYAIHRHLYVTGSVPHAVSLTYEEFLLVSLSLSLGI